MDETARSAVDPVDAAAALLVEHEDRFRAGVIEEDFEAGQAEVALGVVKNPRHKSEAARVNEVGPGLRGRLDSGQQRVDGQ